MTPHDRTANGRFRIIAIVDEAVDPNALLDSILERAGGVATDVLVVHPGADDEDQVDRCIERLQHGGIPAYGWAAHPDPRKAVAGALVVFAADEVIDAAAGPALLAA